MSIARSPLQWIDDKRFLLDSTEFTLGMLKNKSDPERLVLAKTRELVEAYVDLLSRTRPRRVLEIGIYSGGSAALVALLADPARLVGVELDPQRVAALDSFARARGLTETIRAYYGVDQADRDALRRIAEAEFGNEPLDLVLDDASHRLAPTRNSFETLFPLLRPGGMYVIEDWNWEHVFYDGVRERLENEGDRDRVRADVRALLDSVVDDTGADALRFHVAFALHDDDAHWRTRVLVGLLATRVPYSSLHVELHRHLQEVATEVGLSRENGDFARVCEDPTDPRQRTVCTLLAARLRAVEPATPWRPLSQLAVELLLVKAAGSQDAVRSLSIDKHWIVVTRGAAPIDPLTFRIADAQATGWGLFGE